MLKFLFLGAYNTVHDFDVICISETFLDSDYSSDDQRLNLQGYVMIRSDHPSDTKRGGVCMYYKEHLAFTREKRYHISRCNNKKGFVTCLYRSPTQTEDETNIFISGFEQICSSIALESPLFCLITGDLNAKGNNWWQDGINNVVWNCMIYPHY